MKRRSSRAAEQEGSPRARTRSCHLLCPALGQTLHFSCILLPLHWGGVRGRGSSTPCSLGITSQAKGGDEEQQTLRNLHAAALLRGQDAPPWIAPVHGEGQMENLPPARQIIAGADIFFQNELQRLNPLLPTSPPMAGPALKRTSSCCSCSKHPLLPDEGSL